MKKEYKDSEKKFMNQMGSKKSKKPSDKKPKK